MNSFNLRFFVNSTKVLLTRMRWLLLIFHIALLLPLFMPVSVQTQSGLILTALTLPSFLLLIFFIEAGPGLFSLHLNLVLLPSTSNTHWSSELDPYCSSSTGSSLASVLNFTTQYGFDWRVACGSFGYYHRFNSYGNLWEPVLSQPWTKVIF